MQYAAKSHVQKLRFVASLFFKVVCSQVFAFLLHLAKQGLHLLRENSIQIQASQIGCITDQTLEHRGLGWELLQLSSVLSLVPLLALNVMLSTCLLCLLFICKKPELLVQGQLSWTRRRIAWHGKGACRIIRVSEVR